MLRSAAAAVALLLAAACAPDSAPSRAGGRVRVVTGFATLAEMAERVGGDRARVADLTPPGTEPHDSELDADDLDAIEDADLVLYVGGDFQPALARAAGRGRRAVDLLRDGEQDPHIWLDPVRWSAAVTAAEQALAAADPEGRGGYGDRATALRAELDGLHASYERGLARCRSRLLITAHDSFGHLARRYRLETQAIVGRSPEAEPDPKRIAELTDLIRRSGVTTVFSEPLLPADLATSLAREAGVTTAVLDPIEGPAPGGYRGAMERNLATLRTALGCDWTT